LEPYSYISLKNNRLLAYNTLNGEYFESKINAPLKSFVDSALKKENLFVILISENDIKESTISDFIENCQKIFIGDIVKKEWSTEKPLQFVPAQYLTDFKITEDNLGDNITENITDLFFYLDSRSISNSQFAFCVINRPSSKILLDFSFITSILQQLKSNKLNVHLIGIPDFFNPNEQIFLNQLTNFNNFNFVIYQNYQAKNIDKELLNIIVEIKLELVISVDSGFDIAILKMEKLQLTRDELAQMKLEIKDLSLLKGGNTKNSNTNMLADCCEDNFSNSNTAPGCKCSCL